MQRNDRWPSDYDPDPRSRRSSASSRGSKKKKSPPASATSTPKKVVKPQNLDFLVTGKQCLKRSDRANSLPASSRRRPSLETPKAKKPPSPNRNDESQSSKSRETSLEDDMSLELSQVSDFEDTNSKYGVKKFNALATSTPKKRASLPQPTKWERSGENGQLGQKPRSASVFKPPSITYGPLQHCTEDAGGISSLYRNADTLCEEVASSSLTSYVNQTLRDYSHSVTTELDYSSVSPEYSQSSAESSPAQTKMECSQDFSSCVSSWLEGSETRLEDRRADGEWNTFWVNYNNSIAKVPMKSYYDQCPTPYRTENIDLADLDFSEGSRKRSPEDLKNINSIIRNEGLHLTPRETQNIIKCAHILGNVLSKAIERRSREKDEPDKVQELLVEPDPEKDQKKKTMTLDLKETNVPEEVIDEKRCETVTTQTDISLPNTRSAPRIFENILRQLSRSSIDEDLVMKAKDSLEVEKEKSEKKERQTK